MLRLISIIGIAIAMVIGFVALSSKMKDDYTIRSRVVDVLQQMTELAAEELQCEARKKVVPEIEMPKDAGLSPLLDSPVTRLEESSPTNRPIIEESAINDSNENSGITVDTDSSQPETESADNTDSVTATMERNTDIVKSMGYKTLDSGDVEIITLFSDIAGESGKILVKADSRIVISCTCNSQALSCRTVESNINKNYLPKSLTRQ